MQTVLQHEDLGRLTAAPGNCLNTWKTKIWTQTISRQVSSRPANGRLWSLIFSQPLELGCGTGHYIKLHIFSSHQHEQA